MADDKIKYSDIIEPDDSIEKLIKQLGELNEQYGETVTAIRAGADRIVHALKIASGATEEGRKSIDEASNSASRLKRAQDELKMALSDTGRQIAWLKAQTSDANKSSVEHQRYIRQAVSSYDKLKSDLKQTVELYKSLTAAERADSQMGEALLANILNLKDQLKALDAQMKPHIEKLTEVERAERKLAFLQSDEGKRLLELKAKISEITNARRQQKAVTDPLVQAEERLAQARSENNVRLKLYSTQIREANRVAELQAIIANSAEGSYNRLSAQYSLNKIKLNQMSQAEREAADSGKALEAETNEIYQRMIKLQEATGNYRLSVGHYQRAWDGLGFSVSQVVRELPALAVSMNTFFLGISNNIPMVVDEINRLRAQNKLLREEGKQTISVTKSIVKSLFSFNTALVIGLTVLSMYGGQMINWVKRLFKGKAAVMSLEEALDSISKELESSNANFGANVVTVKNLQKEWSNLKTTAEKNKWIRDNKSEFEGLGIAINDVSDAESAFVNNTQTIIDALKLRAKAEAARTLATKKYEEALISSNKAEALEADLSKGTISSENIASSIIAQGFFSGKSSTQMGLSEESVVSPLSFQKRQIEGLRIEAKEAEMAGDAYFKLAEGYKEASKAGLKAIGIRTVDKVTTASRQPRQRDLTDTINNMSLSVQKKYERSITELEQDEYAKRKKEAIDTANAKIRALKETFRKNEDYIKDEKDRYKELTEDEKKIVEESQGKIQESIINIQNRLSDELLQIEIDRQINELKIEGDTIKLKLKAIKKGSQEELELKLKSAKLSQQIALLENSKKPINQQQKPSDITAGFSKQATTVSTEYDMSGFEEQQKLEAARFNSVKHSDKEIEIFRLTQEKERWEKQIALAESGALDWSDIQIEAAKATVVGVNNELKNLKGVISDVGELGVEGTILSRLGFDKDAISAADNATSIILANIQAITEAEVQAAQAQVDAAHERVEAAQQAYEAEVEARNNGYANNVATAKKELEQEKKRERDKQKMLEAAQRRQEAVNTVTQASSLVTASANLWSSFSSIPIIGPALALAAIASMWTSFAVAKVKAKQVTAKSDEYGEGGLEFLEGGSHASGNDIDLGTTNKNKHKMRAEGGEALAIINKKQTRKYRKVLPDVVDSLNKGTFEDKYLNAFNNSGVVVSYSVNSTTDLSKLENDVNCIKKQNEIRYNALPDGTTIVQHKNVKRLIRN